MCHQDIVNSPESVAGLLFSTINKNGDVSCCALSLICVCSLAGQVNDADFWVIWVVVLGVILIMNFS